MYIVCMYRYHNIVHAHNILLVCGWGQKLSYYYLNGNVLVGCNARVHVDIYDTTNNIIIVQY